MKFNSFYAKKTFKTPNRDFDLEFPAVMGIFNATPDSFFDGGKYSKKENVQAKTKQLLTDGADIIDVGGYSTRPGADDISIKEELNRVIPVIDCIRKENEKVIVSIDTFRAGVAKAAINAGADIVNDVSGGSLDADMYKTIGLLGVPYVLMHMRGTPKTMQSQTKYGDIVKEVDQYFKKKIGELNDMGASQLILDPGFGFAKTIDQNYTLLKELNKLTQNSHPLMVGVSRKSMIYKIFNNTAEEALNGTTVLNTFALLQGASIMRVHDVKEAKETIQLIKKIQC